MKRNKTVGCTSFNSHKARSDSTTTIPYTPSPPPSPSSSYLFKGYRKGLNPIELATSKAAKKKKLKTRTEALGDGIPPPRPLKHNSAFPYISRIFNIWKI